MRATLTWPGITEKGFIPLFFVNLEFICILCFFKKAQNAFARLIPFEKHTHADKSEIERERSYDYIFYLQSLESHDKQAQFLTR